MHRRDGFGAVIVHDTFDHRGNHRETQPPVEEGRYVVVPATLHRIPKPPREVQVANVPEDDFRTIDPWAKKR